MSLEPMSSPARQLGYKYFVYCVRLARSFFKLRYEPQGALAMGIEARAEVEFRLQDDATEEMARQVGRAYVFGVYTSREAGRVCKYRGV